MPCELSGQHAAPGRNSTLSPCHNQGPIDDHKLPRQVDASFHVPEKSESPLLSRTRQGFYGTNTNRSKEKHEEIFNADLAILGTRLVVSDKQKTAQSTVF